MAMGCRLALDEMRLPHKTKFSQLQSAALTRMVADAKGLTAEEVVQIATLVAALPWAAERDATSVLDALPTGSPPTKRRRGQQDFTSMHHYMSAMQWESLQDPQVAEDVKLQSIISHLIRLGLRCPSEPTNKWLCSLWTFLCVSQQGLQRMTGVTKQLRLKTVRSQFTAIVRRAAVNPSMWVEKLPGSAVEFMRDFRPLFDAAFPAPDMAPICCPINVGTVLGFDMTYKCRGGLSGLQPSPQPDVQDADSTALSLPMSGIERMTMGLMHAFQQSQMHMMQTMMHNVPVQPQILPPQLVQPSLAALADRPFLRARSATALPGFAAVEDVGDDSPASVRADSAAGHASHAVLTNVASVGLTSPPPVTSPVQVAPNSPPPAVQESGSDPCTNSDALRLLDAMDERRAAAKVAKPKAAKGAPTGGTKDTKSAAIADPKPMLPKAAKPTKAKGKKAHDKKAKAKGKKARDKNAKASSTVPEVAATVQKSKLTTETAIAKPKVAAPSSATPATPLAVTNEDASPSGKPKAKAKAGSKRKAAGATDTVSATGPARSWIAAAGDDEVMVLIKGCSKCRWSQRGCGRCRDPNFTGLRWNTTVG